VGIRSFLRGDDLLEDRTTQPGGEARSLPSAPAQPSRARRARSPVRARARI